MIDTIDITHLDIDASTFALLGVVTQLWFADGHLILLFTALEVVRCMRDKDGFSLILALRAPKAGPVTGS